MVKQRFEFIDLAKGICIILVVLDHIYGQMDVNVIFPLQMFRMPLYFFLSGLFFKKYDGLWNFTLRKVNRMIIPFLAFWVISGLIYPPIFNNIVCGGKKILNVSLNFWNGLPSGNPPIWFLLCLFWQNLMFYIIYLVSGNSKYQPLIISILSLAIGVVGFNLAERNFLWFGTALTAMPFFCCGFIFNKFTNILYPNANDKFMLYEIPLLFVIVWLVSGDMCFHSNSYGVNLLFIYLGGGAGLFAVIMLAKQIKYLPIVSYFGRYSIIILVTHFPIAFSIILISRHIEFEGCVAANVITLLTLTLEMLVIPFVKRYMPHISAQKDLISL